NLPASSTICASSGSLSDVFPAPVFNLVGLPLTGRYQAGQTVVDIEGPGARTATIAFERRNQSDVCKAEFGLAFFPGDLEHDVGAVPGGRVLRKADVAVHDVPDDLLAWHPFGNALSRGVHVLITVRELRTEPVGAPVNLS